MTDLLDNVVIIGGGLGGIALAIALSQRSIPCRVYESRAEDAEMFGSGVTFGPNGCRVLDRLGVWEQVKARSYESESHTFKDAQANTTRKTNLATERLYGYKNHRIYRETLKQILRAAVKERKVPVEYESRFEGVVEDTTAHGVTFLINGRKEHASLLIGADGIHSTVRKHLTEATPEYMGLACVYGHLPTNLVPWLSEESDKACTIQDVPGSLFMVPEVKDGSDLMVGRQFSHPALDRAGWDALAADPDQLYKLFSKDYEQWDAPARLIMDQLSSRKRGLLLWPYRRMPKLAEWASATGRTIIIGDAAHAMPPSSGQGVNQAFEDAYTLALMLTSLPPRANLPEALSFWRNLRQARIDAILRMAAAIDASRLPEAERRNQHHDKPESHASEDLQWLYSATMDDEIAAWIRTRT
ncbi:hypothetical protein AbraIFM66951_011527 [Aspergillus brasiliensis]|uniref:FAD-binding domain-containing protein n=1 Tax=Aspergillus brasiliensis TaxID=319629 RepID=A0A9W5YR72_9EURO|nr:hypothetical protein AbraCBS73388_008507 [Aspergillus brasiliensis]GKZ47948.1 hypothetical protein AbraIFM66951_011527 [Aspergillus brasiliensis]